MLADFLALARIHSDLHQVPAAEARDDRGEGQAVEALQETSAKRTRGGVSRARCSSVLARIKVEELSPGSPPLESASSHA